VCFDGIDYGHADWSAISASLGVWVDLQLEPVGSAPEVADSTELLALVRYDNNFFPLLVVLASWYSNAIWSRISVVLAPGMVSQYYVGFPSVCGCASHSPVHVHPGQAFQTNFY
jgi:hypothetical protein